jgi:hypothetical protein
MLRNNCLCTVEKLQLDNYHWRMSVEAKDLCKK